MRGMEVKRRMRTHGLATGLDLMSSRERTRRYLAIEGTHRLSFLGSREAMLATWGRGVVGWVQPATVPA